MNRLRTAAVAPSSSMTFIQSSPKYLNTSVFTTCWFANNMIATGGKGFLSISDRELVVLKSIEVSGYCTCVRPYSENEVAAMIYYNRNFTLSIYSLDLTLKESLIQVPSEGLNSHFSINSRCIIVANPTNMYKPLKVYNRNAAQINTIDVVHVGMTMPYGVHIHSDNQHFLVSHYYYSGSSVSKYKLFGDSMPLWSCKDIKGARGLCEGWAGEVYVASINNNCIYQLNYETGEVKSGFGVQSSFDMHYLIATCTACLILSGEILRRLTSPELVSASKASDVSVNDDEELLVACSGRGLLKYKLTRR